MQYPSRVAKQRYGKGLFASESIDIGRIIQKFKGPIVSRCKIPSEEICYALLIGEEKWLIPKTAARYINHSCNPNYIIGDDLYIKTIRSVEKGEQLTIIYNFIYPNENPGDWDPRIARNILINILHLKEFLGFKTLTRISQQFNNNIF